MVAGARTPIMVALAILISLCAAPGALALGATDPGIAVAESTPVDVTHLLDDLADEADAPAAVDAVADAPAANALDTAPLPDAPAVPLVPREPTPAPAPVDVHAALVMLPDSGRTLDELLGAYPELADVLDEAAAPLAPEPAPAPVTAPAVAAGVAGAAALSALFQAPFAGRFYTRLAPGEALAHPVRRRVYETIERDPGVHPNALRERLGIGNGALLYHLDVLRRERLVTRVDAGRFTRYFVTGRYSPTEMRSRATVLAGSAKRVLDLVRQQPGVPVKDAADAVGLSVPSVHRTAKRLESAGLVEKRPKGRGHALYPAEAAVPAQ